MFKKTGVVLALVILGALSLFLVDCGSSSSRPSGLLYVLSQEESNVSSYAVDLGSGNLSLINSNAATCPSGTPCGPPLQISLDPQGKTAFVLNQGSISAYTVNSDGSLTLSSTPAATFATGETALGMTRDAAGDLLFVITNAPAIYVYSTNPGSTSATLTSTISSTSNPPLTRVPTALSAITYTPTGASSAETVLFVTSSQDLRQPPNDNTLGVYAADSSGNWTEQPNSPYSTLVNPTAVLAVNTTPPGQPGAGAIFVYVGNTPSTGGDVSAFELCSQVTPPQCQQADVDNHLLYAVGVPSGVGQHPIAMLVDPTNTFLYIACNGSNQVYGFSMGTASGKLTALTPPYQPTGTEPVALAMHGGINTNSEFLYSSNNLSSTITGWPVVATTGSLGNPITVQFPPGSPYGMAGR